MKFNILSIMSEDLVSLDTDYGTQVWGIANMTKKKIGMPCWECRKPIGKKAYRPITNKSNRMDRICLKCIEMAKTPKR